MTDLDVVIAHRFSIRHRMQILASDSCGCFYCLSIFEPSAIVDWCDFESNVGQTARCPNCAIDSVIGSASGYPVTSEFLLAMKKHWF